MDREKTSNPSGRKRRTVTLRDIGLATGYSANTVSRSLADKPDIAPETKEKIRKAAEQMGYIVNASASFLRSGVSRIISIIVGDISNPHFSVMVKEMQTLLQKKGYTCVIFNTEEKPALEKQAIITSLSQNVDGILICPCPNGEENIAFLRSHHTPFVLVGRRFFTQDTSYVICDDEGGGYLATRYLLTMGHRDILFLNGPGGISSSAERLLGYQRALEEANVPYRSALVRTVPIISGKMEEKILQALEDGISYTAILAFSDLVAWQMICLICRRGQSIPKDYSVIGFDNIKTMYPLRLTSVSSSKTTMARRAVELLLGKLERRSEEEKHFVLETRIVEGDTVSRRG